MNPYIGASKIYFIFHSSISSAFAVCGTAARRSKGTGFASLRVLDSGVLPCR